jgi:multidrug efflux system outer membrane protein
MRRLPIILLLAALALTACASTRPPKVALPAAYEAPAGSAAIQAASLDRWWLAFDDPQLTTLIEQALRANPDVRSAAARLREIRATRDSVLAQLLPAGDAAASIRRTDSHELAGTVINIPGFTTSGVSETRQANFNASWEVDLFGRVITAAKAAGADVAAQRFAYEGTRTSIAAQVADAYFQTRGLAIQLEDARETARIQRSLYEVASRRAALGLAATSDADRIAGDLAQAQSQAAALEANLQVERRLLLILCGRTAESTANVAFPASVGAAPPMPATLPGELLARRPDVREAQMRLLAQVGQQNVAALAFLPTVNFTPGIGWTKTTQPGFTSTTQTATLGGDITQPVLAIPHLIADLRTQKARTQQAAIAYEKTVQTAFSDSEAALVRLDADRRSVALLTDGEVRAARAFKAAQKGYSLGLTDLQTALSAEQSWRAIHGQLTAAQVQEVRGAVTAFKAIGGGWAPPPLKTAAASTPAPPR